MVPVIGGSEADGFLIALAAAACYDTGYALQAIEARKAPSRYAMRVSLLGHLLRRRRWLTATALSLLGFPLQVLALTKAPITLVQPTSGDVIAGGTPFRILWQSDDNVGLSTHDIALSSDGGKTFSSTVAGGLSGNAQAYTWSVPPDIAPSRTAMIRITATDAAGNTQSAVSGLLTLIGAGFTPNSSATYTYDSLNRLTSAVLSDGRTVRYAWDSAGNLIAVTVSGQ